MKISLDKYKVFVVYYGMRNERFTNNLKIKNKK